MYVCMHVCMFERTYLWMDVCMYTCMHSCMYIYVRRVLVCMYRYSRKDLILTQKTS